MTTDYSSIYFRKPLNNLEYQDIVDFFVEPKEETTTVEFKSFSRQYGVFEQNLRGVTKGICAFLNSEGGILIWGAPEGKKLPGQKHKTFQGTLSPLKDLWEKDRLINKISDPITPLPIGINVKILEKSGDVIYVFEVQKSNYSPHQFRNKYWCRLDGQTEIAPHYLIEALFRQIRYPNIEGFIKAKRLYKKTINYILEIEIYIFNFSPLQNEENMCFRLTCEQGKPSRSHVERPNITYALEGHQLIFRDSTEILHFGSNRVHSESLIIDADKLLKSNNEIDLILLFGGKFSPLKVSQYKINLRKIGFSTSRDLPPEILNLSSALEAIEVNMLLIDKQNQAEMTKEKILKEVLGERERYKFTNS